MGGFSEVFDVISGPSLTDPGTYILTVRGNGVQIQSHAYCFNNP
jgi:hypothetical protein